MSDENTPTTDQVRDYFVQGRWEDGLRGRDGDAYAAEFDRWLAERDKRMKFEGWDEACQGLAWCFDNGPECDALPYMVEHNPFRDEVQS